MALEHFPDRILAGDIDQRFASGRMRGIGSAIEKQANALLSPVSDGIVERTPADPIEPVRVGPPVEQESEHVGVGVLRGLMEGRAPIPGCERRIGSDAVIEEYPERFGLIVLDRVLQG